MPIPFAGLQDETIFSGLNGCVAGWALLVLAPRWQHTQGLVLAIVAVYCALYVATLAGAVSQGLPAGSGFSTLAEVSALFSAQGAVLAGWTHYIAFDLFVGRHIVADSITHGIPHFVVAVFVLPLTLLGGPAGLGLYLAIKCMWTRSTTATERKGE